MKATSAVSSRVRACNFPSLGQGCVMLSARIIIADYDLKAHQLKFTTHMQLGFVGKCKYSLRGPDEPTTPETPLTVRQQIFLLAQLAFYTGVGYKTAMGMGRTRPL